ncbi:MAG: RNA-dependent RNA polymerase [Hangzhou hydrellia griseola narnavirus 1]|nr:MAG: RNA-dependent RNA polymerase [Hangzhou hydrellia griseola narnavirus 1]
MSSLKETILAIPVVNSEVLRGGNHLRFFIERSKTFPLRCSDKPTCPELFVGPYRGNLPAVRVPSHQLGKKSLRLAAILNSVLAGFVLVWPKSQYGLTPNYPNQESFRPLARLVDWIIRSYIHNGEAYVAKRLKLFAAWARYKSGVQLHERPETIARFPFCDSEGVPQFENFFIGSISSCASHPKSLMRLSRISRAFPPGDALVTEKSLVDHRELMTSTAVTPPELLRQFAEVIRTVSRDQLGGVDAEGIAISHASCWERGRKHGGAAEELYVQLVREYPGVQYASYVPGDDREEFIESCRLLGGAELGVGTPGEGLPHQTSVVETMAFRACVKAAFPDGNIARRATHHKVIAVPDRGGFKVRVITAGEACMQSLAHNVRKVIYRNILPRTPSKWAIAEDGVRKFLDQLSRPTGPDAVQLGDWVALSCDMKSATDRFPHDTVESINDSLESNLREEDRLCPNWVAWRSLSGPQYLRYPGEDEAVLSSCGNLMGTAPSWVHLNLMNLCLFRTAWSLWASGIWRRRLSPIINRGKLCNIAELDKSAISQEILRICRDERFKPFVFPRVWQFNKLACVVGDDLGACCPFAVSVLYEVLLELCNGRTSFGKHYVQPWEDGSFLLVAEECGVVKGDRLHVQSFDSLRGIVAVTHQYDNRVPMPAWFQIGSTFAAASSSVRTAAQGALCSFGHIALSRWRGSLLRMGLPVYLPQSIGGLGWPHPRGFDYSIRLVSTKSLLAYQVIRGFKTDPIEFAHKILELRCTWQATVRNRHYAELIRLIRGYFSSFSVSKTEEGLLAPLTRDRPIGLYPQQWSLVTEDDIGIRCRPLADVIDKIVLNGLNVGFLLENLPQVYDQPYLEIGRARRRHNDLVNRLIALRPGIRPYKKRSEYVSRIKEDEEYLKSLYIYIGDQFEETFPHLSAVVLGQD